MIYNNRYLNDNDENDYICNVGILKYINDL